MYFVRVANLSHPCSFSVFQVPNERELAGTRFENPGDFRLLVSVGLSSISFDGAPFLFCLP